MQRIELSPLFKFAYNNDLKYSNPLAPLFKAPHVNLNNLDSFKNKIFIPIDKNSINHNHYERHTVEPNLALHASPVIAFITPVPSYQKLSPNLHRFDYVY